MSNESTFPPSEELAQLRQGVAELEAERAEILRQGQAETVERQRLEAALQNAHDNFTAVFVNAEAARQASEVNFEAVFEASPEVMSISRVSDGRYLAVNQAAVTQTGYTREDYLANSAAANQLNIWLDMADRDRMLAALRASGQVNDQEFQFRIKDGTVRHALLSVRLITFQGELCVFSAARDITQRVEAEQARAKAEAALRESEARYRDLAEENARLLGQSQKQAATETLMRREVNHRVKNNLAAILGLLQLELKYLQVEDPTPYQLMVQDLTARIQSLLLVHNLLAAAPDMPVPLTRLAAMVMRVAPALASRRQAFPQMDISPMPVPLTPKQANAVALILNELTTNALKYANRDDEPVQLCLEVSQTSDEVCLVYRDNGPGFPTEVLRGERQSVGLYLVRALAENDLEGRLELSNDRGAIVRLAFRLQTDPDDRDQLPDNVG